MAKPEAHRFEAASTAVRGERGFTIIEVMVVLVLLALLAAVAVPRFASIDRRKDQVAVGELQDLLSVFAYRDSLGSQRVAFGANEDTGEIELFVKEFDPHDPLLSAEWLPDRFVQPVRLPKGMEIVDVRVDDRSLPLDNFFIASVPGTDRPKIELRVVGNSVGATLLLEPYMIAPVVFEEGKAAPAVRLPVDLDQVGLDRGQW